MLPRPLARIVHTQAVVIQREIKHAYIVPAIQDGIFAARLLVIRSHSGHVSIPATLTHLTQYIPDHASIFIAYRDVISATMETASAAVCVYICPHVKRGEVADELRGQTTRRRQFKWRRFQYVHTIVLPVQVKNCVRKVDQCQEQIRLAYAGHPGHGKSDCQNTAGSYTCWPPQVKQVARAGRGDSNITKDFTEHRLDVWHSDTEQNRVSNVVTVDTPGQICKVRPPGLSIQALKVCRKFSFPAHITVHAAWF